MSSASGALRAAVTALLLSAAPAGAQGYDGAGLAPAQTERLLGALREGLQLCARAEPIFRTDCLSGAFRTAARKVGNNAAYWEADVALTRISRRLAALQRAAPDPAGRRVRLEGERLSAIDPRALPEASAMLRAQIARARDDLARASAAEAAHFAPISDLLGRFVGLLDG